MMGDDRFRDLFDEKPFYPALALIRIPSDTRTTAKQPDENDDFGTGFFVTKTGLLLTVAKVISKKSLRGEISHEA